MSTEEVVVKFYDAICEYGRPGRLGKTFQTKNQTVDKVLGFLPGIFLY